MLITIRSVILAPTVINPSHIKKSLATSRIKSQEGEDTFETALLRLLRANGYNFISVML
jgi:hypothetical protein